MEDTTNTNKILVAKCEGDSVMKIHGIRLNSDIRIILMEWDVMMWTGLVLS
jgi:hypothetical protein